MASRRNDTRRKIFLLCFSFCFAAVMGFLMQLFIGRVNAINPRYNGFNAGDIISDYVMADYTSMSEGDIQQFLKSKNPCNDTNLSKAAYYSWHNYHIENGHYVCMADESFDGESAAHIIWQAAQDYHINPKVLIVLLEKEQGLVTDTWPNSDLQYRSATGYGCPDHGDCNADYYGFKNQIRNAAELYRWILDNGSKYYPVGYNNILYNPDSGCGSSTVYVANRATAALYQYTPYQPNGAVLDASVGQVVGCGAYGNLNFYYYFTEWFGDTHGNELHGIYLPDGVYQLKTNEGLALSFTGPNNGDSAIISDSDSNNKMQQFELNRDGKYYRVRNVGTGKYLDVFNNESYNGTKVELWDGNGGCSQKWLVLNNDSWYRLVSACSSEAATKSLDVSGGAIGTAGTEIKIWESNGSEAQQWNLVNLSAAPVNNGEYSIRSTAGRVLVPASETPSGNERMIIWENSTSSINRYSITRLPEGYYLAKNTKTGLYLTVRDASISDGAEALLSEDNMNTCAQKWIIEKNEKGFRFINSCSGKSLDINEGKVDINGNKVQIWNSNSSDAQRWMLNTPTKNQPVADGDYVIESGLGNRLRLDVVGSGMIGNGTNVDIWTRNGGDNQKFKLRYDANTGYYSISISNGYYLDAANGGSNGANVQVYQKGDGCFQQWMVIPEGEQYYIVSACERNALDVVGANMSNGANTALWALNGGNNQKWIVKNATSDLSGSISDGSYVIASKMNSNLVMDIFGGAKDNGGNIGIWGANGGENQTYKVVYDASDGYYTILNEWSGRSIDATGGSAANGVNLEIWSPNSSCAQKWDIVKMDGNQHYRIASACNPEYSLDVAGADNHNGANILLWKNHNNDNQQWTFIKR
ncbi:RICIN domain-containing protein [Candidatus Saccharibacteria bacterium]|nr:RICIN domain-containing protein [Candidatus Saccharibacteria bacterium]